MSRWMIISILIIGLVSITAAQNYAVDKGVVLLNGEVSFSKAGGDLNEADGEGVTTMILNPQLGYFVIPNFALGADLLFTTVTQGDFKTTALGIGPMAAYFFGDAGSTVLPFIGASLMLVSGKYEPSGMKESQMDIHLAGGASYLVAKNVAITGKVFYIMESYKPEDADEAIKGNQIGISFGVSTFIY